ncbi:hypothetical protein [Zestomonas carbonaria]|uniref:Uncharacterized protein n=1 Tax=Zestomonas carbonaria TaxID=2762745 RepID=A0A7U7ESA5_9GAMM|nr:hypothetical protein [Pseudomonas carbonaria]CAD5110224.1 hypothetical protein PSEWESI4_04542 [Pseudomonas carbonaria]
MTFTLRGRKRLFAALVGISLLAVGAGAAWFGSAYQPELNGRYSSQGQVRLSSGKVVDASHSILFNGGRFYAMSRQGDVIVETTGRVEPDFRGGYQLRVDSGDVTRLNAELDSSLLFNLLYSRHQGSVIHLEPLRSCLYARETRQLYCASTL